MSRCGITEIFLGGLSPAAAARVLGAGLGGRPCDGGHLFAPGAWVRARDGGRGIEQIVTADEPPEPALRPSRRATRLDHVCIATWDLALTASVWRAEGGRPLKGGDNEEQGVRGLTLRFDHGIDLELLAPLNAEGRLADHLRRHGEGLHHLTFHTSDLRAVMRRFQWLGLPLIGTNVVSRTWQETYVHPRTAGGALIQIAQTSEHFDDLLPDEALDGVLAGRYRITGNVMREKAQV